MKISSRIFRECVNEFREENIRLHKEIKLLNEESLQRDIERDNQTAKVKVLEDQLKLYEDYEIRAQWDTSYTTYYYYIKTFKTLPDTLKLLNRANLYIKLLENTIGSENVKSAKETFDKLLEVKCNEHENGD